MAEVQEKTAERAAQAVPSTERARGVTWRALGIGLGMVVLLDVLLVANIFYVARTRDYS